MAVAVGLFECEVEERAGFEGEGLFELVDADVGLADGGVDSPGGLRVAIDRHRNRPALLVKIGAGSGDIERLRAVRRAFRRGGNSEFVEMKVAVVLAAGAFMRKRVVGEQ